MDSAQVLLQKTKHTRSDATAPHRQYDGHYQKQYNLQRHNPDAKIWQHVRLF
jgi:hypothetical protein